MSAEAIAARLLEAHASGRQIDPAAGTAPADIAEAYRVQDIVARSLGKGGRVPAWKVIPPDAGAEPRAAPIPAGRVFSSPARFVSAGLHMIGIESEIAFRFARELPARASPYSDDEVAAAVGEALVTIEICDTRLTGWKEAPALWKLADLQSNSALVSGGGVRNWREIDFGAQSAELWIDGERRAQAKGSHACVNPFRIVPWIANHCAARCGGLRAGDLVTAGSWTGISFVNPGAEILVRFPGIGEAAATILG